MTQRSPAPDMRARVATGLVIFGALIAGGTLGYMILERWSFIDALFMTVITVTTVGYREVQPLDTTGRLFTIFLVLFGVGTAFYLLTTFVALVIEGDLGAAFGMTRMKGRIEQLRDHHILCGYGRVGEEIAREFGERKMTFVVVEQNDEALGRAVNAGHLVIQGDATSDDVLLEAGVLHARTLLAASDSDSGNTYITLTARALNPDLLIVARAGKRESEARAKRAGADRVISPYAISGRRMALSAIQPNIVDFMDTLAVGRNAEQILAEIEVTEDSGLFGLYIRHLRESSRVTILGLQRASGELIVGPREDVRFELGDRLMVVGPEDDVAAASQPVAKA
ncbi:MAG: potassium channel protein [Chloroflexi bacterium]|nr:potassium channel protein [Chloroflexota bacterium]